MFLAHLLVRSCEHLHFNSGTIWISGLFLTVNEKYMNTYLFSGRTRCDIFQGLQFKVSMFWFTSILLSAQNTCISHCSFFCFWCGFSAHISAETVNSNHSPNLWARTQHFVINTNKVGQCRGWNVHRKPWTWSLRHEGSSSWEGGWLSKTCSPRVQLETKAHLLSYGPPLVYLLLSHPVTHNKWR